jgi:hypothetical protein
LIIYSNTSKMKNDDGTCVTKFRVAFFCAGQIYKPQCEIVD